LLNDFRDLQNILDEQRDKEKEEYYGHVASFQQKELYKLKDSEKRLVEQLARFNSQTALQRSTEKMLQV